MQLRISRLDDKGKEQEYVLYIAEQVRAAEAICVDFFDQVTIYASDFIRRAVDHVVEEETEINPRKVDTQRKLDEIRDLPYKSVKQKNKEKEI